MDARELADLIGAFDDAMAAEAVPAAARRRVVNRLVYGHPDGMQDRIPADQAEDFLRAVDRDAVRERMRAGWRDAVCEGFDVPPEILGL